MIVSGDFIFQTSLVHPGNQYFVANALKGDCPVDETGYLVIVNEFGDRVAFRVPGGEWETDSKTLTRYNLDMPYYVNAIHMPIQSIENK